jgi:hypothetical protein
MKVLLASLMLFSASLSALAESNVYTATAKVKSRDAHGGVSENELCDQAKVRAEALAMNKCYEDGNAQCHVVSTAIVSSNRRYWIFSPYRSTVTCKVAATVHPR